MKLKPGVKFGNHIIAIVFAKDIAEDVYKAHGFDFIITSMNDGKHMEYSKHYSDEAFDCRTKHLPDELTKKTIASEIKTALGEDFDVILESLGGDNEHLHLEYDP